MNHLLIKSQCKTDDRLHHDEGGVIINHAVGRVCPVHDTVPLIGYNIKTICKKVGGIYKPLWIFDFGA